MKISVSVMAAVLATVLVVAAPGHGWAGGTEKEILAEEAEFDDAFLMEEEDEAEAVTVADPLIHFNRAMFTLNDKLYFWFLKPVAIGYRTVVPLDFRICVKNFFHNLTAPVRVANALLQGKPRLAGAALGNFLVNTTVGVAGLADPASQYPALSPGDEDLGQTLGAYGMGNGFYLVWPILGPSTLRDTLGMVGDRLLDPSTYLLTTAESIGAKGVATVNTASFHIGVYEALKEAALEPYVALRDGYIQYRSQKVAN